MKIAYLASYGIGNVIMKTPAIQALRELYPDDRIDLIVEESRLSYGGRELLSGWNKVDNVIVNRSSEIYDLAVVGVPYNGRLRVSARSATKPPDNWPGYHEPERWLKNEVEYNVDIIRLLGWNGCIPPLHVELRQEALDSVSWMKKLSRPIVIFGIGYKHEGEWWRKHWGNAHFAQLTSIMHDNGWTVVLVGGPEDRKNADEIALLSGDVIVDTVGEFTLSETVAATSMAEMYVGNDTGSAHIAAALGKVVAVLYGITASDIVKNRPWTDRVLTIWKEDLECQPCTARDTCQNVRCMTELEPEDVADRIFSYLKEVKR